MNHGKKLLALGLTLAVLLCAGGAWAADKGPYAALHGGWANLDDMDFGIADVSYDTGYMAAVAGGYDFGWLRLEGELSHRRNDVDTFEVFGLDQDSSGRVSLTAFLVNVFFEWDNRTPLIPYLGVGLGGGVLDFDDVSGGGVSITLEDDFGPVAQLILGVGFDLGEHWHLYTDLRGLYTPLAPESDPDDDDIDDDYSSDVLTLGLQYRF